MRANPPVVSSGSGNMSVRLFLKFLPIVKFLCSLKKTLGRFNYKLPLF